MSDAIEGIKQFGPDCLPVFCLVVGLGFNGEEALRKLFNDEQLTRADRRIIEYTIQRLKEVL